MAHGRPDLPVWNKLKGQRFAHRGYHDKPQIPENSLPAFKRAIERGWGAELDVHLLKDGTLAVFHDSDLKRCTGAEGFIEDLDLAGLKELRLEGTDNTVPLFDEVLELFENATPLVIELKTFRGNAKELVAAVCARLDSYKGDFCIESFDPRALLALKKLRPEICRGQLAANFLRHDEGLPRYQQIILTNLWFNLLTRPDFVAYKFEDRDTPACRRCVRRGVQEFSWTIDTKDHLLAVEADGGLGIFERFDPEK